MRTLKIHQPPRFYITEELPYLRCYIQTKYIARLTQEEVFRIALAQAEERGYIAQEREITQGSIIKIRTKTCVSIKVSAKVAQAKGNIICQ